MYLQIGHKIIDSVEERNCNYSNFTILLHLIDIFYYFTFCGMICYNSKVLISKYFIFKQKESVMFETILYSVENDLATISLNRPEVSNGFNIPMCQEILAALEDAEK